MFKSFQLTILNFIKKKKKKMFPVFSERLTHLQTVSFTIASPLINRKTNYHERAYLQCAQVVLLDEIVAEFHERPNGRRRCVELANFVLVDDGPVSVVRRVERRTFELD